MLWSEEYTATDNPASFPYIYHSSRQKKSPSYKEEDCLALHIDIQMLKWSDMDFK